MRRSNTNKDSTKSLTQRWSSALRKRPKPRALFLSMSPLTLCVTSVVLIGLMAILYLSQVGEAVDTNHQLEQTRQQQSSLMQQNQDLAEQLAKEQSPLYIAQHAQQQGLQPADPKDVHTIAIPNLQTDPDESQP